MEHGPLIIGVQPREINLQNAGCFYSAQPLAQTSHEDPAQTAVTITLTNPRLYINSRFAADSGGVVEAKGMTALIDVPARGQYVLALDPQGNSKFLHAGQIKGNAIEFQSGGDGFRIECSARIATGGDRPVFVFLKKEAGHSAHGFGSGGAPYQYH